MSRLWFLFKKCCPVLIKLTLAATYTFVVVNIAYNADELKTTYIRSYVGSKVYYVTDKAHRGGGTGFLVKGEKTGKTYIVTNHHVCDGYEKDGGNVYLTKDNKNFIESKVIYVSKQSDLCLVKAPKGHEGLTLGDSPAIGSRIYTVGHPALKPLTITHGEINGSRDVTIEKYVTKDEAETQCSLPKHKVIKQTIKYFDEEKKPYEETTYMCLTTTKNAYVTNATVYGGSSGSPVVNSAGEVVGVVFATDRTDWGLIVNHSDLKAFLKNR